jgi:pilus assembly protein Flp/PilA
MLLRLASIKTFSERNLVFHLGRAQSGQGLVEYALILSLIAIVVIAALTFIQGGISGDLSKIGSKL